MNDTHVTIRGWIGGAPRMFSNTANGSGDGQNRPTTIFRVGVTPRYFSRQTATYTDGVTTWYSVRCYGSLAKNAAFSLRTGMPVLVRGRLTSRLWTDKDGIQQRELSIMADSVGVELSNGLVNYSKHSDKVLESQPGEPGWMEGDHDGVVPDGLSDEDLEELADADLDQCDDEEDKELIDA